MLKAVSYKSQCLTRSQCSVKVGIIIVVSFEKSAHLPAAVLPKGSTQGSLSPSPQEGEGYATLLFPSPVLKTHRVQKTQGTINKLQLLSALLFLMYIILKVKDCYSRLLSVL